MSELALRSSLVGRQYSYFLYTDLIYSSFTTLAT